MTHPHECQLIYSPLSNLSLWINKAIRSIRKINETSMCSHIWNRELAEESLCMYSRDCQAWGWLTRIVTPFTTTTLCVDYLHWCITALQSIFEYVCEVRYLGPPLYNVKYFYCVQRKYLKKLIIYLMFTTMWSLHLQKRPIQSLFYWNKSAKVAMQMCNTHLFWH